MLSETGRLGIALWDAVGCCGMLWDAVDAVGCCGWEYWGGGVERCGAESSVPRVSLDSGSKGDLGARTPYIGRRMLPRSAQQLVRDGHAIMTIAAVHLEMFEAVPGMDDNDAKDVQVGVESCCVTC